LYAGSGNFGLPLAKLGKKVFAIELDKRLVDEGRRAAEKQGISGRIKFVPLSCEQALKRGGIQTPTVILDPPRSGAKVVCELMAPLPGLEHVIYVSCSLPTLQRDLQVFAKNGFKIKELAVVDMFPQTGHIEILVRLLSGNAENKI
jgi:23S rRNA (uracil1939-C5)-methyltransferase